MNKEVLYNYFEGAASIDEGQKVKAWIEESAENKQAFYKERKMFDAILLNANQGSGVQQSTPPRVRKYLTSLWFKIAGVVVVTLLMSYLYQLYQDSHAPVSMYTVSVPAGQRTNITLPDGTNIWLNARTTLQYPSTFNQRQRTVILNGEAYFDVSKNKKKPFIVQTKNYNIEVLGTKFNVDAYALHNEFETALMQGSVKVSSRAHHEQGITLSPNQKVYLKDGKLHVTTLPDHDAYRWKEGLICFKNEPFLQIMKEFEKYYGIRIIINNEEILKYQFTGKFRQSDGVDYALHVLQNNINFKFERNNDNQIIYIN